MIAELEAIPVAGNQQSGTLSDFIVARGHVQSEEESTEFVGQLHAMMFQLVNDSDFTAEAILSLPRLREKGQSVLPAAWMRNFNAWYDGLTVREQKQITGAVFLWV